MAISPPVRTYCAAHWTDRLTNLILIFIILFLVFIFFLIEGKSCEILTIEFNTRSLANKVNVFLE